MLPVPSVPITPVERLTLGINELGKLPTTPDERLIAWIEVVGREPTTPEERLIAWIDEVGSFPTTPDDKLMRFEEIIPVVLSYLTGSVAVIVDRLTFPLASA